MRVTPDTNVIVSAALWGGNPRRVVDAARDGFLDFYTSGELLGELIDVITRERFAKQFATLDFTAQDVIDEFIELAIVIEAPSIEPFVIRDPDDDAVIACAVASQSDVIVSGDKDLLDLGGYKDIRILKAIELLTEIGL